MFGQKKTTLVLIECACCHKWRVVRLDPDDLERYVNGMFVQFAFTDRNGTPYLTPAERELFISACFTDRVGTCSVPIRFAYPKVYN